MNETEISTDLKFSKRTPTFEEFRELRTNAGWQFPSDPIIRDALSKTLFGICVETQEGKTIGMGRVVGDGGLQAFVTDVIVDKEWQGRGVGSRIMLLLMEYIEENASFATIRVYCSAQ